MTKASKPFGIPFFQYLDPSGQLGSNAPAFAQSKDSLLTLYRHMLLTREVDAKAVNLQRTGKMSTYPSSLGQEAVFTGMGDALMPSDVFVPHYRDQATLLKRGLPAHYLYAYWGGDERANDFPVNREDFPICVPIGTQLLHAAGIGYAIKLRQQKRAVLVSCGDGATSQGSFMEALNFVGSFKLPVIFVINNNQWAISVSRQQQSAAETLAQKAIAAGLQGIQVDGNDVIAVRHHVSKAIADVKKGQAPIVIEAMSYRLCDHTTADDAKRYTPPGQLDKAWQLEPLKRLEALLTQQHGFNENLKAEILEQCKQKVTEAVNAYQNMEKQAPQAMFDYLYHKLPTAYQSQYQHLIEKTAIQGQ